jgi:hypothetical protein
MDYELKSLMAPVLMSQTAMKMREFLVVRAVALEQLQHFQK